MAKKFNYFNVNGLGESIRYILHYGGHKFEDIRYEVKDWPIKEVKDSLPYGQMPLYIEGDKSLTQSIAIARYVASISNLLPTDPWAQAELDVVVHNIYDFWGKLMPFVRENDPVKKAALKKEFMNETLVFFFSRFEKELQAGNGFFAGKLSWADFILTALIETSNLLLGESISKDYPLIAALGDRVRNLPGVKEYVASRPVYVNPHA